MTKRYKTNFREKLQQFINSFAGNVILRSDLSNLGLPRQVSRALQALVEDGELIKLGYGVYAKAKKNKYIDIPILQGAFEAVCMEALDRLGIDWELGSTIKEYNEDKTTQVPIKFIVKLNDRYRGTLGDGRRKLIFEKNINAK
ncbi:MAG: type IV toxin-antitoxin system AbiEi family antitoxin domain-containing protein [Gammaproteobacteria bacterium]|nr:type IV toxin-antitoxin system AbiEi family antitoxin domain-containing protein [Gammaproteobacteria bacterium]